MFWFSLQLLSETFVILRRIEQGVIKMHIGLHVKYALFLPDFKETWIFLTDIRKCFNFMKIRLVGVELFHANGQRDGRAGRRTDGRTNKGQKDRQTDPTTLTYTLSNFVRGPMVVQIIFSYLSIQNLQKTSNIMGKWICADYKPCRCTVHFVESLQLLTNKCT